jgi:hypothetical protein
MFFHYGPAGAYQSRWERRLARRHMRHAYGYRCFGFLGWFWILFGLMWIPGFRNFVARVFRELAYLLFG